MDRFKRTANLIKSFYQYKRTLDSAAFVKEVCDYYDLVNNEFYTNQGTGDFEKGNDIDSGERIEQTFSISRNSGNRSCSERD